ncbi:MAG: ABC transporter ATP-binding protein [Clostridiales bacterium]|nr:ABC transporter ATP-binding protein [Clostridiales bacterium]
MVEIKNLSLFLGDKQILNNINYEIKSKKIIGLIGPNGVGKTSLIKSICGIYKPTSGSILYDGEDVYNSINVKRQIGYVPDENNFFNSYTIKAIIKYYKLAYEDFNENKFHHINKIFNIPINKRYFQLSKGMKMRVNLMMAFSIEPKYLILDEPTSGLDPILKNKLLKLIVNEVCNRDVTVIISSHNLRELEMICDEVVIINEGEIVYSNSLENMKKKIRKIQVAFDAPVYEEDLKFNGIYKVSRTGRVFTIITEDYSEDFKNSLKKFNPLFMEEIDLNLEDMFIYRVGGEADYEEFIQ